MIRVDPKWTNNRKNYPHIYNCEYLKVKATCMMMGADDSFNKQKGIFFFVGYFFFVVGLSINNFFNFWFFQIFQILSLEYFFEPILIFDF